MSAAVTDDLVSLAASHGLALRADTVRVEEAGLDYRVAFAKADDGTDWVLRVPRRADVSAKIADEARILAFVAPHLSVAVPSWRVQTAQLVAYPRLPGEPGLTLDPATKAPIFHVEPTSAAYAVSLGKVVAELHRVDPAQARAAGIPSSSPAEVRASWRADLDAVAREFTIADALRAGWDNWLADDLLWPKVTTFTHGELYPAHVLVDADAQILSVLDWTTAKVGDPAVDFMFQHMMAGPAFDVMVRAYVEAGGREHPRLADRCAALVSAGPIGYAVYALTTGQAEHREAAAAQLNPST